MSNIYLKLSNIIILITIVLIISLCSWFFFIKKFNPDIEIKGCITDNCISSKCTGYNCICNKCVGDFCKAGDCIGENCRAGDCNGKNCKAGDCYGNNCKPGVCIDPSCTENCPQINKQCKDGDKKEIIRPFYYQYTKLFPINTILNPPLCKPYITVGDLRDPKVNKLGLKYVQLLDNKSSTIKYGTLYSTDLIKKYNLKDTDKITATIPNTIKDHNCNIIIYKNHS